MRKSFTKLRKSILELINKSTIPVTIQQIKTTLSEPCDQSSVYRGIRFLEKKRLVDSFSIDCEKEGNTRFYFGGGERHSHFIHCERCHRFTRVKGCALGAQIHRIESRFGYRISRHTLLFTGVCRRCSTAKKPGDAP
jgi:Fur family ferric uptake transcriptional regulator